MTQRFSSGGPRWKGGAEKSPSARQLSVEDYAVDISTSGLNRHFSKVKIKRMTDGKVIFPFDGSETLGPFDTADEARNAGRVMAHRLIEGDIKNPE